MRLPFPEYLPLRYVVLFAIILCGVQQLQGTDFRFSIYSFLFLVIVSMAFNVVGGFTRPSGGYIFFYAFGVVVGITGKAVLNEPADSNLVEPNLTMLVFLGGAFSLLVAGFISRRLRTKRAFLQNIVKPKDMRNAILGCMITGITVSVLAMSVPHTSGTVLSALTQLNQFLPMAIILGVIHQVRKTGGASAISFPVLLSMSLVFIFSGIILFSKAGLFLPVVSWFIAAASVRYRMRVLEMVATAFIVFMLLHYLVPYSQYGRNAEGTGETILGNAAAAFVLLGDLDQVRNSYLSAEEEQYEEGAQGYYNNPQGLFDRLQILKPDDRLIGITEERGTYGLAPISLYFLNLIPHIFYPNKPNILMGNLYAHEIGDIVSDEDESTGISFSPSAEAYHLAKWFGVLVVAPLLWIMLFTLFDSICGDVRKSPWGLLMIAVFSHMAPEGMLGGVVYMLGYNTIAIFFAAIAAAYVMPIIGTLMAGPEKANQRRTTRLLSTIKTRRPLRRAEAANP